jgi:transposase InsO family protein
MHHGSARLTPYQRELLARRVLEQGWTIGAAAAAVGVSRQTGSKWVARYGREGRAGMQNRPTRPHHIRTVSARVVASIRRVRLQERWGPHRISWALGLARSTVYAVLRRLGLSRLRRLEPRAPVQRYEWPVPGDLVHLDTKKLGRIDGVGKRFGGPKRSRALGWNFVHVAIDDHSRLAYAEEHPDETGMTAALFTARALEFFAAHGIEVRRILTDNGTPYRSKVFAETLAERGIAAKRTRPYRPQTNGKAEAFVKILINGWAYARPFRSSQERSGSLPAFIDFYNRRRPHGGLDGARPIDRVRQ